MWDGLSLAVDLDERRVRDVLALFVELDEDAHARDIGEAIRVVVESRGLKCARREEKRREHDDRRREHRQQRQPRSLTARANDQHGAKGGGVDGRRQAGAR